MRKTLVIAGLLRERLWAYPVSLVVMAGFIAYQPHRYSHTHGTGLIILTALTPS